MNYKKTLENFNKKIDMLEQQKRETKRLEREAEKNHNQRLCFIVGELVLKHFPKLRNIEPGTRAENAKNFAPFNEFLGLIASDKNYIELFEDCISSKHNNPQNV